MNLSQKTTFGFYVYLHIPSPFFERNIQFHSLWTLCQVFAMAHIQHFFYQTLCAEKHKESQTQFFSIARRNENIASLAWLKGLLFLFTFPYLSVKYHTPSIHLTSPPFTSIT